MRKDELIVLHVLLHRLRRSHPSTADAALPEYDAFGVTPNLVGKSKAHHHRAVELLAKGMADVVEDDRHVAGLFFAQEAKAYALGPIPHHDPQHEVTGPETGRPGRAVGREARDSVGVTGTGAIRGAARGMTSTADPGSREVSP